MDTQVERWNNVRPRAHRADGGLCSWTAWLRSPPSVCGHLCTRHRQPALLVVSTLSSLALSVCVCIEP
jgi:hypothetical protein